MQYTGRYHALAKEENAFALRNSGPRLGPERVNNGRYQRPRIRSASPQ